MKKGPPRLAFGGSWTSEKLERLDKYLRAYTTIMRKPGSPQSHFRIGYIDAFAGSGYVQRKAAANETQLAFDEVADDFADESAERFIDGSARIALAVEPSFHRYIFIERNPSRCENLEELAESVPDKDVKVIRGEANQVIAKICATNWKSKRAVLFLDPYGMEVEWGAVCAIAKTRGIDLWYLFPFGLLNRFLRNDGQIDESSKHILNKVFGTSDWLEIFFKDKQSMGLFGTEQVLVKDVNFDKLQDYIIGRLTKVFPYVARNPLRLFNSKKNPLYLLCFASHNRTGFKIAEHILGKRK